jgi:hypothetical protein
MKQTKSIFGIRFLRGMLIALAIYSLFGGVLIGIYTLLSKDHSFDEASRAHELIFTLAIGFLLLDANSKKT